MGVDFFYTDRFLPPNIDIKIKLIRNKETFGLRYLPTAAVTSSNTNTSTTTTPGNTSTTTTTTPTTTKNYRIVLKDLKLHMRKVLPTLQIRDNYRARLLKSPCFLPYKASKLRHFTIPGGVSSYSIPNVATGILPKSVIFAMIKSDAMNLHPGYNPFDFQHFNLTSFNLKKNHQNIKKKEGLSLMPCTVIFLLSEKMRHPR